MSAPVGQPPKNVVKVQLGRNTSGPKRTLVPHEGGEMLPPGRANARDLPNKRGMKLN